jgi:hypothetical protein
MREMLRVQVVFLLVSVILYCLVSWVNEHVPELYMDEYFHVTQTSKWCNQRKSKTFVLRLISIFPTDDLIFSVNSLKTPKTLMNITYELRNSWNPDITTLPGLYLMAILFSQITNGTFPNCNDVKSLRLFNAFIAMLLFSLLYLALISSEDKGKSRSGFGIALKALEILSLPFFFFFTPLFYTDVLSTFMVVLMYTLGNYRAYTLSGFVSLKDTDLFRTYFASRLVIWHLCADRQISFGCSSLLALL